MALWCWLEVARTRVDLRPMSRWCADVRPWYLPMIGMVHGLWGAYEPHVLLALLQTIVLQVATSLCGETAAWVIGGYCALDMLLLSSDDARWSMALFALVVAPCLAAHALRNEFAWFPACHLAAWMLSDACCLVFEEEDEKEEED
jgi:hypothetical protein